MQASRFSFMARNDVLFGVCQAIGEDLGFNPNFLRVALAGGLMWNPKLMLGIYAALFVVVLASRLLFPAKPAVHEAAHEQPALAPQNDDQVELAKAA